MARTAESRKDFVSQDAGPHVVEVNAGIALPTWIERERAVSLWMHGASTRLWVLRLLIPVSRVGDGWIWYLIVALLPWAGGVSGTSKVAGIYSTAQGAEDARARVLRGGGWADGQVVLLTPADANMSRRGIMAKKMDPESSGILRTS